MILYTVNELKIYETRSDKPNADWTGKADFVVDESNPANNALLLKIKELAPCFDYVTDAEGNLIDVVKNDVVLPEDPIQEPTENVNYDELAAAITEGVNEI